MEYGSMSIQRLQSGRWLNWGIRFFLTAALTASQTAGGYAPFALGCIAAAGPGADGAAALLGGVTGALLFLDFQQVLALAAVGILILTAATAFRDTAFLQKPWVLPVLAAGMVLAVGGIYVLQSLDPLSHAAPCAAASALTGVSALFFTRLFQPEEDRLAPEGLLFLGAALTLALGDLTILNVSVGRVLLCALLAYTAYDQGPMTGVTAGLGLGLITDLSAGTSGPFTAAYGVAGLCAAKCRRRSMAALAFFSGAAAAMLTSREELAQTLLLETVAGSLLFLALPRRIFGGKRLLREAAPDTTQRTALKTHLNRAAEALRELYDSMSRTPPPQEENPAVIFDRAAEKVCRGCALCELCWQKDYTATFNALNDATPYLLERGKAKAKEITELSQRKYDELIGKANDYSNRTRSEADEYNKNTHANADSYSEDTRSDADAYAAKTRQDADTYMQDRHNEADQYMAEKTEEGNAYLNRKKNEGDAYVAQKTQEGDQYLSDRQNEGNSYVAQKTNEADQYFSTKHSEADTYESEVQRRAADYDAKTRSAADDYAQQVRDNLESQSKVIEGNIQGLKQFETEYRARLTEFLGQLVSQVSDTNNYSQVDQNN